MPHDRFDWIWEFDRLKDVCADAGVQLHSLEFRSTQGAWLVEYVLWDSQLSCVMQKGCSAKCVELLFVLQPKRVCQRHRKPLHATNVAVCDLILGVDCQRESLDRLQ